MSILIEGMFTVGIRGLKVEEQIFLETLHTCNPGLAPMDFALSELWLEIPDLNDLRYPTKDIIQNLFKKWYKGAFCELFKCHKSVWT